MAYSIHSQRNDIADLSDISDGAWWMEDEGSDLPEHCIDWMIPLLSASTSSSFDVISQLYTSSSRSQHALRSPPRGCRIQQSRQRCESQCVWAGQGYERISSISALPKKECSQLSHDYQPNHIIMASAYEVDASLPSSGTTGRRKLCDTCALMWD